jgi:hypothetical protein
VVQGPSAAAAAAGLPTHHCRASQQASVGLSRPSGGRSSLHGRGGQAGKRRTFSESAAPNRVAKSAHAMRLPRNCCRGPLDCHVHAAPLPTTQMLPHCCPCPRTLGQTSLAAGGHAQHSVAAGAHHHGLAVAEHGSAAAGAKRGARQEGEATSAGWALAAGAVQAAGGRKVAAAAAGRLSWI